MRFRLRLFAPVAAAVAACAVTAPASGFYFPGWPGSGQPRPRVLIPPDVPKEVLLFPWWLNGFGLLLIGVGGWQLFKRVGVSGSSQEGDELAA